MWGKWEYVYVHGESKILLPIVISSLDGERGRHNVYRSQSPIVFLYDIMDVAYKVPGVHKATYKKFNDCIGTVRQKLLIKIHTFDTMHKLKNTLCCSKGVGENSNKYEGFPTPHLPSAEWKGENKYWN